jgi:hypothetical protein
MAVRIQPEDFDIRAEVRAVSAGRTDIGAIVTFTGTVRGGKGNAHITEMTLEHYPGMTEVELQRIEAEAQRRWPLQASGDGLATPSGGFRRGCLSDGFPQDPGTVLEKGNARGR